MDLSNAARVGRAIKLSAAGGFPLAPTTVQRKPRAYELREVGFEDLLVHRLQTRRQSAHVPRPVQRQEGHVVGARRHAPGKQNATRDLCHFWRASFVS